MRATTNALISRHPLSIREIRYYPTKSPVLISVLWDSKCRQTRPVLQREDSKDSCILLSTICRHICRVEGASSHIGRFDHIVVRLVASIAILFHSSPIPAPCSCLATFVQEKESTRAKCLLPHATYLFDRLPVPSYALSSCFYQVLKSTCTF